MPGAPRTGCPQSPNCGFAACPRMTPAAESRQDRMHAMTLPAADAAVEILLVEDSATQAEQLRHILEQQGYRVVVAGNGREALGVLAQRQPALVISDILMPEIDGYELTRRLKADPGLQHVP